MPSSAQTRNTDSQQFFCDGNEDQIISKQPQSSVQSPSRYKSSQNIQISYFSVNNNKKKKQKEVYAQRK
jgi:hypothetical protein